MIEPERTFLSAVASAMRAWALYPPKHPTRNDRIDMLIQATTEMLAATETIEYFVHEDSFFVGQKLVAKESLTLQWMMRAWQAANIRSLSISKGVDRAEFETLISRLAGENNEATQHVAFNQSVLTDPSFESADGGQLRKAYSNALDLVRTIGGMSGRRGKIPIASAKEAVNGLVESVLVDAHSALLLSTMRAHDEYTFFHMVNVCILSVALGATIGLDKDQLSSLGLGAILHDMGKVGIPAEILNRSGALSQEDWNMIHRHPVDGAAVILSSWEGITPTAALIAYEHHIHVDGTGYPAVRANPQTDLLSRIVSVADTFDAITSRRAYRRAEQRQRALEVLMSGAGPHYDPRVVRVFVRMLGYYPPGSVIELSDGSVAVVVENNSADLARPKVKTVRDKEGATVDPTLIDLAVSPNLVITRALDQESVNVDPASLV